MRVTNSKTESFKENVELYSKALAVSGFDYQSVKKELLKFEHVDPKDLINDHQIAGKPNQVPRFISTLLLTQDYPTLEKSSPLAKSEAAQKLLPRENLIASSKPLPNLGEMLSPTIQSKG